MTQLQFIPLKTPEGRLCGHARVAGGFVELQLRADAPGRAAVLTAAGVTEGPVGSRIAVQGAPVQAVAVHEAGRIRCLGLARGVSLTPEQVRARLMTPRRAGAEGAARMETDAARALARAAAQGEAARAAESAAPAMAQGKGDVPAAPAMAEGTREARAAESAAPAMAQGKGDVPAAPAMAEGTREAQAAEPAQADGAARPAERAREKGAAPDAQAPAMAQGRGDVPAAVAQGEAAQAAAQAQADGAARPAERAREKGAAPDAQAPAMAEGKGDAPAAVAQGEAARAAEPAAPVMAEGKGDVPPAPAETADRPSAPASIEQSAADSESFMALLRRADAAFQRLSRRVEPMPGADMLPGAPPEPPRRSGRTEDGVRAAAAIAQDTAAPADGAAAEPPELPRMPSAAPAGDGPRRARRLPGELSGWSDEVDRLLEDRAPLPRRDPVANPFPNIFPGAVFERVTLPGGAAHLAGEWQRGGERMQITAVPGAYSPRPPAHLPDFTRYIRARSGGYWIRVRPAPRA